MRFSKKDVNAALERLARVARGEETIRPAELAALRMFLVLADRELRRVLEPKLASGSKDEGPRPTIDVEAIPTRELFRRLMARSDSREAEQRPTPLESPDSTPSSGSSACSSS